MSTEKHMPDALDQLYIVLPYLEQLRDDEARLPSDKRLYKPGVLAKLVQDTHAVIAKEEGQQ